ncbi:MAG TPA: PKD domain-containing protein [Patescibacteria group bacterium]|nr:PKD domain-containing protein [Patescibacteria group bacterium]
MLLTTAMPLAAYAANPGPSSGSVGLEAVISSAPPTTGATIVSPANGAVFTSIPITVSGSCPTGVLVKVFSNNVFSGSTTCANGSYQLQIDLFSGRNDLVARVYDALDQAGPDSSTVSVTFNDAQFAAFGSRVTITSNFARRGANPGDQLSWPITVSGGATPYALSVDWGDGKPADLQSLAFAGTVNLSHVYSSAGTYKVVIKASDSHGVTAFLQVVAVANGAVQTSATAKNNQLATRTVVIWWPLLLSIPLLIISFWLGGRHELYTLRKHLESQQ